MIHLPDPLKHPWVKHETGFIMNARTFRAYLDYGEQVINRAEKLGLDGKRITVDLICEEWNKLLPNVNEAKLVKVLKEKGYGLDLRERLYEKFVARMRELAEPGGPVEDWLIDNALEDLDAGLAELGIVQDVDSPPEKE